MTPVKHIDPITAIVANNIRYYRNKLELTQSELSYRAGLDRNYIGVIERGEKNPSLVVVAKIARALNVSICSLVEEL